MEELQCSVLDGQDSADHMILIEMEPAEDLEASTSAENTVAVSPVPNIVRNGGIEWGDTDTKVLLDYYKRYLPQIGPFKTFRSKREMYKKIAKDILRLTGHTRTPEQCENRYKTVLKRRNAPGWHRRNIAVSPRIARYEEELARIRALRDSLDAELLPPKPAPMGRTTTRAATARVAEESVAEEDDVMATPASPRMRRRPVHVRAFLEMMRDLHQEREKGREERERRRDQRHTEKMQLLRRALALLEMDRMVSQATQT
uniref:Uncharacterized protein n=1 Tax=Ixodes ricinus TaxID=34613 RepID=V5HSZ1_IXORI